MPQISFDMLPTMNAHSLNGVCAVEMLIPFIEVQQECVYIAATAAVVYVFFFCSVRTDWPHLQPCLCSHRTTFRVQSPEGKKAADILVTNTKKKHSHTTNLRNDRKTQIGKLLYGCDLLHVRSFFFTFSQHLLVTGFSVQKPLDEPCKRYYGVFHAHVIYYFIQWPFSIVLNVVRI